MGASVFGLATGTDYGVVFGAFAGAVFYVATATNIQINTDYPMKRSGDGKMLLMTI
ncbi:hypothetical protein ABC89_004731, partial [Salmonella enterica subsp. salamae]|nr:hypothetical protein [Salmonella enterica subsp. salamae]